MRKVHFINYFFLLINKHRKIYKIIMRKTSCLTSTCKIKIRFVLFTHKKNKKKRKNSCHQIRLWHPPISFLFCLFFKPNPSQLTQHPSSLFLSNSLSHRTPKSLREFLSNSPGFSLPVSESFHNKSKISLFFLVVYFL